MPIDSTSVAPRSPVVSSRISNKSTRPLPGGTVAAPGPAAGVIWSHHSLPSWAGRRASAIRFSLWRRQVEFGRRPDRQQGSGRRNAGSG